MIVRKYQKKSVTVQHSAVGSLILQQGWRNWGCREGGHVIPPDFGRFGSKNHFIYRKIVSSNMSHLEAHTGFFRLLMKGILDPYVL